MPPRCWAVGRAHDQRSRSALADNRHRLGVPHLQQRFGRPQRSLVDEVVAIAPTLHIALIDDPPPEPSTSGGRS